MTERPTHELDAFEERLLAELRTVVEVQATATRQVRDVRALRRRELLWSVPVAGAAAVAVAVALVLRPVPAYAVSGSNGKDVTVKVNRLEGAQALRRELHERGIAADITYLPAGVACEQGRYADSPSGLSLTVAKDWFEVELPAGAVGTGDTFVLSASVTPGLTPGVGGPDVVDGFSATVDFGIAHGVVPQCVAVRSP